MADIGTVAYDPNAKFAIPRHYIKGLQISIGNGWEITDTGNPAIAHYDGGWYQQFIEINILPAFFEWSSNIYSLDYVFDNLFTYYDFDTTHNHFANRVGFSSGCDATALYIHIFLPGAVKLFQWDLPPAPSTFWIAPAPCAEILS